VRPVSLPCSGARVLVVIQTIWPALSCTGMTLLANHSCWSAAAALAWLAAAKASSCWRVKPSSVAIKSAECPADDRVQRTQVGVVAVQPGPV